MFCVVIGVDSNVCNMHEYTVIYCCQASCGTLLYVLSSLIKVAKIYFTIASFRYDCDNLSLVILCKRHDYCL